MKSLLFLLLFLLLLFGCSTSTDQSINLTDVDIPVRVDEMIRERLDTEEDMSITYTRRVDGQDDLAELQVCYEVKLGEEKLFGLASKVEGKWYVTVPNDHQYSGKCPIYDSLVKIEDTSK